MEPHMELPESEPNRSPDRAWLKQARLDLWDGGSQEDDPLQTRRQQVRTVKKKLAFLGLYRKNGNVLVSCEGAGIARSTVYGAWMKCDRFRAAFDVAREEAVDRLEDEARRRAVDGTERPVFYKGRPCGVIREYSDALLMFLLKGRRPDVYRDRHEVQVGRSLEEVLAASEGIEVLAVAEGMAGID